MTKTIELSDKHYRDLNTLIQLGIIMSAQNAESEDLFDSAQYFFSHAKEFNSSDMVKYSKAEELYFPTKKMDELVFPFVQTFQEDFFWQELAFKLASRDFEDENSPASIRKMSIDQRYITVMTIADDYEEEFYQSGLAHFGRIEER